MDDQTGEKVRNVVSALMDRVLTRVLVTDPFVEDGHRVKKPLYAALVPDEIFKGSHFERRFVTACGGLWEKLAKVVAESHHGHCELGKHVRGDVGEERLKRIQEVLNRLEHRKKSKTTQEPNWAEELEYVLEGGGPPVSVEVVCDVFISSTRADKVMAFEIKAPLPNSDQTKVSKEKMFKLLAMSPPQVDFAYFALAYNPYGQRADYSWSFPMRWFDMHNDESVLIGDEFWELIGGKGTYECIINEVKAIGYGYKERVYREFLSMEPPSGFNGTELIGNQKSGK